MLVLISEHLLSRARQRAVLALPKTGRTPKTFKHPLMAKTSHFEKINRLVLGRGFLDVIDRDQIDRSLLSLKLQPQLILDRRQ